jgi:ribonuclease E
MRTAASAGLSALRILEDEAARGRGERICLRAGKEAAIYVLNKKRGELADIELRYGVVIEIIVDESFEGARMTVESSGPRPIAAPRPVPVAEEEEEIEADEVEEELEEEEGESREEAHEGERQGRRRRRRRRGGRGRGRREGGEPVEGGETVAIETEEVAPEGEERTTPAPTEEPREGGRRRRRRRGRSGAAAASETVGEEAIAPDSSPMVERPVDEEPAIGETAAAEEPQPAPAKRTRRKKAAAETEVAVTEPATAQAPPVETADQAAPAEKPARKRRSKKSAAEAEPGAAIEPAAIPAANNDTADETSDEPRRSGWWQRTFG